jgi:hypothetical protein
LKGCIRGSSGPLKRQHFCNRPIKLPKMIENRPNLVFFGTQKIELTRRI